MIVHGITPPYRSLPLSLRERSSYSLQNVPNQNYSELNSTEQLKKISTQQRPKSSPLKENTQKHQKIFKSKRCWQKEHVGVEENEKGSMYLKVIQPGYIFAKRKSRINVTVNLDELWAGASIKDFKKSSSVQDKRDLKIKDLQQEIDDLRATLAEERNSNRLQFQQFVVNTKIDVEVLIQEHRDHIKTIEEEHELKLENMKALYEAKINKEKDQASFTAIEMQKEIDSIRETLQNCTENVTSELEKKWLERKERITAEQARKTEKLLKEQRLNLKKERILAVNDLTEQHVRELDSVKAMHHKEIKAVHTKFAALVGDAENFKIIAVEIEKLREDLKELQDVHDKTKEKLRKTKNELEDVKVQLQGYELSFSEKVAEVEERYALKIQGLMLNNADIRRNYMKKCAQLLDVQNNESSTKERNSIKTKTMMKTVILARAKADVSLVPSTNEDNVVIGGAKPSASPLKRPHSAPLFKPEIFQEDDNMFLTISQLRTYRPNSSLA